MFNLLVLCSLGKDRLGCKNLTWRWTETLACTLKKKNPQNNQPTHKSPCYGGADRGFNRTNSLRCFSLTFAFKYKPAVCCCTEASPFVLSRHVKSIWVSPEKGWPRQEPINRNSSMQSWLIWNAFYQASYNGLYNHKCLMHSFQLLTTSCLEFTKPVCPGEKINSCKAGIGLLQKQLRL